MSLEILVIHTPHGTYSAPLHSIRLYSKKVRRGALGWFAQLGDSANPALVLWPKKDAIWLPLFAVESIERKLV